jgi:hypothetical protein
MNTAKEIILDKTSHVCFILEDDQICATAVGSWLIDFMYRSNNYLYEYKNIYVPKEIMEDFIILRKLK